MSRLPLPVITSTGVEKIRLTNNFLKIIHPSTTEPSFASPILAREFIGIDLIMIFSLTHEAYISASISNRIEFNFNLAMADLVKAQ